LQPVNKLLSLTIIFALLQFSFQVAGHVHEFDHHGSKYEQCYYCIFSDVDKATLQDSHLVQNSQHLIFNLNLQVSVDNHKPFVFTRAPPF